MRAWTASAVMRAVKGDGPWSEHWRRCCSCTRPRRWRAAAARAEGSAEAALERLLAAEEDEWDALLRQPDVQQARARSCCVACMWQFKHVRPEGGRRMLQPLHEMSCGMPPQHLQAVAAISMFRKSAEAEWHACHGGRSMQLGLVCLVGRLADQALPACARRWARRRCWARCGGGWRCSC